MNAFNKSPRGDATHANGNVMRSVRYMVDELRAESAPALPWDAVEEKLFARIDQRAALEVRRGVQPRLPSPLFRVAGFAVAAAVLALGIASAGGSGRMPVAQLARHRVDVAALASVSGLDGAHDLASLRPGDVVEAKEGPVAFGQAGLVRWTLAAGGVLRVKTVGLGHTVELERGALRAEVTPRDSSEGLVEAFAVEVGDTRVAVHGTAFSVRRDDARVIVDVEHGAVAIGPKGNLGATTAHLLVGPSRGSFSQDGGSSAWFLDRDVDTDPFATASQPVAPDGARSASRVVAVAPVVEGSGGSVSVAANPVAAGSVVRGEPHAVAAPGVSSKPTAEAAAVAARLTADVVRGRVERCFRAAFESAPSTLESVSSTLTIEVSPGGTVRSARFSPPLNAELTACAGAAIGGRFADDAGHLEIPFTVRR